MNLERGKVALYAVGAVAGAALLASAFYLIRDGVGFATAIAAALPPSIVFGFIGLASRYTCRALPLRSSPFSRIVAAHAGAAAVSSGVWILVWKGWLPLVGSEASATPLFVMGALLYAGTVTVHYLMLELEATRRAEEAALRYQVLMREAELKAFKAQVDPHFLFNSLNAVASMCGSRPTDAREMAQRMADFFRLTLRLGALDRITLGQEIDLVTRYLAIEQVRFGERLRFQLQIEDAARERPVPPLLLQPLIENAVRHGIASMVEGGTIELKAFVHNGALQIRLENPADPDRVHGGGEGIGLQNARGRLAAISGGRGSFRAEEKEGRFMVEMEIPA
jgi:hypothetical protein